ncbi:PREDICTED: probable elongation factor 1-delta isoform X2 [Dufourea novaeangliae]|uniref:probable elongation factor 1-delta isoform X2 n=1 Tax=Dufourea novaeangliae TaxID=178035 RepID=UPI000767407F|nr:PREDICTED: probable elongation factor 1-delta isoform X2 [Dufourea novaeangliae]
MEKSALAQEKVWFDKPSYDKAERLYFEKMAKVVTHKIMESCSFKSEISVTNDCEDILNCNSSSKTKFEKSKDNKLLISENIPNDNLKNLKTNVSKSNKDENEYNIQKRENVEERQKSDNIENDIKKKENISSNDMSKKYNTKEVKEKKNKADTRHRNKGKGKNDIKEVKENVTPPIRNEQQLPNQGNQQTTSPILSAGGSLANEVAKARQHIKQSLQCMDDIAAVAGLITPNDSKKDNADQVIEELRSIINKLEKRVRALEDKINQIPNEKSDPTRKQKQEKADDEDVDLFGSDSEGEDAEAAKIREERLAAYAAKKSKKPALIAKSNIILDVKPWDDETDMKDMETEVRKIETDGLLWGAAKLVPLAFGIHKLQISCVVEDEKVSVDWLTEKIQEIEDFVQSVDIAAFNKV